MKIYFPKMLQLINLMEQEKFTDLPFVIRAGLLQFHLLIKPNFKKVIQCGYVKRKSLEEKILLPEKEDDYIKTESVRTVTFEYILNKYNINKIELLMIDTEGYDFELIKIFPFNILRPRVIIFENALFSDEVKNQCNNFLLKNSYKLKILVSDTIAIDNCFKEIFIFN